MKDFYCNKRFDISFSDFHKLIKVCLPSNYQSRETRGIYKREYQPCNIIEIYEPLQNNMHVANIYCWLGQKGLTVLTDSAISASLCIETLKNVKQNAEDYKILTFDMIDVEEFKQMFLKDYLLYVQLNSSEKTKKFVIKEYNGDEVQVDFYYDPDMVRLSGATTSLFTLVQLSIEKLLNNLK